MQRVHVGSFFLFTAFYLTFINVLFTISYIIVADLMICHCVLFYTSFKVVPHCS